MTPMLEARAVTRDFGAHRAVDSASLTVGAGEIVGLIGANGAGKTTLLRMLLGLLAVTSGEVSVFGEAPSRASRTRLGYVPQGLGLYRDLTVAENLEFVARAFGADPVGHLPAELAHRRDALVGSIGLGRQRQLAYACALVHDPELLVLDEPTSGVSSLARARLWDRIHDESERGVGVLITTHHLQEAQQCDRLVVMAAGRVVATGTIDDVIGGHHSIAVTTGSWSTAYAALRGVGAAVTLAGTRVRVADTTEAQVREVLDAASVTADLAPVAATLDEVMVLVDRDAGRATA